MNKEKDKTTVSMKPVERPIEKPAPANAVSHVNNLAFRAMEYCCGGTELGNFNYVDLPDAKKMNHYHKVGGWKANPNDKGDPTTEEDIRVKMQYMHSALVVATTGSGQEYMEPILSKAGFQHVFTFINPDHADTPVKLWAKAKKAAK